MMMMIERGRTSGEWVVGGRGYMVWIGRRHIVQFGAIVSGAVSSLLSFVIVVALKIVFHFRLRFLSMVMVIVGGRCDSGGSIGDGHESRTCW